MPGRDAHRDRHWDARDTDTCPSCGRSLDTADRVDVHHNDEDASNGGPDNLRTRCKTCHLADEHDRDVDRDRRPSPGHTGPPSPAGGMNAF
jgi:hypothetical protein